MLLKQMNKDEIHKEVSSDMQFINRYVMVRCASLNYWAKHAKINESTTITWKSPAGNEWYIMLIRSGKKEVSTVYFTTINGDFGRYVLKPQLTPHGFCIVWFLPHFFKRYRERMKLGRKLSTMQVIKRFMKYNKTGHSVMHDDGGVETTFQDGIGLGSVISLRQRLMRTFITYGMAYGDQVKRFSFSDEHRRTQCDKYGFYTNEVISEMKDIGLSDEDIINKYNEQEDYE